MSIEDPQDVPDVWRQHFKRQNIEFTYRDLDRNVEGVALNTIRRALQGIGTPSRRVAAKIADALGMTPDEFYATRAKVSGDEPTTPFTLPTRADLLNQRERDAVLGVVHALLDARDRHDTDTKPASDADRPPASGTPREDDEGEKTARVVHIKRDDLNEQQSSPETEPEPLPEERPEDAWAARKRDPRFKPDIPSSDNIGEESQDPDDHDEK